MHASLAKFSQAESPSLPFVRDRNSGEPGQLSCSCATRSLFRLPLAFAWSKGSHFAAAQLDSSSQSLATSLPCIEAVAETLSPKSSR